jgi:hypothetical protein
MAAERTLYLVETGSGGVRRAGGIESCDEGYQGTIGNAEVNG